MRGFFSRRAKETKKKKEQPATVGVSSGGGPPSSLITLPEHSSLAASSVKNDDGGGGGGDAASEEADDVVSPLLDIQFKAPSLRSMIVEQPPTQPDADVPKLRFRPVTKTASFRMLRNTARSESYRQIQDWMSSSKTDLYRDVSPKELVKEAMAVLEPYRSQMLSSADRVLVAQEFSNACSTTIGGGSGSNILCDAASLQWRVLVAQSRRPHDSTNRYYPYRMVESNQDLLQSLVRDRNIAELLDGLLRSLLLSSSSSSSSSSFEPKEGAVARSAARTAVALSQQHQTDDEILHLECRSAQNYFYLFARCGVPPSAWVHFVAAVAWAWDTTGGPIVSTDLDKGVDSAILRTLVQIVAVPAMEFWLELSECMGDPTQAMLPDFWKRFEVSDRAVLGESIFRTLFVGYPELFDYFSRTDMDHLAYHLILALDVMIKSAFEITNEKGPFRSLINHLGKIHLAMGVPSYAYPLLGQSILECLEPYFVEEEKQSENGTKASDLRAFFVRLYSEVMSLVYYPMVHQEKLLAEARKFFLEVQELLSWSVVQFQQRMLQVEQDLQATGTYTHTFEELEAGARLAWRHHATFINRAAWKTLVVRDCRTATSPEEIFAEIEKHIEASTQNQDLHPVMTVFRPLRPNESIGPRFWNDQFVMYAGYRDAASGNVLGDPSNVELTQYLEDNGLWEAPESSSLFDVLPLVYKIPGRPKPVVHVLSDDNIYEVDLEHPTNEDFASLGLRWSAMPSFAKHSMRIGGIDYQNAPFNGVYVSTEIAQLLMDRYNVGPDIANVFGYNPDKDPFWQQAAMLELERAIVHSFRSNGVAIFDPHSAGQSFCKFVSDQREQGHDTSIDWKMIGGLAGPCSEAWDLKERPLEMTPSFRPSMNGLLFYNSLDHKRDFNASFTSFDSSMGSLMGDDPGSAIAPIDIPRIVIAYGTQTGAAEAAARKLKRWLRLLNPTLMSLDDAKGLKEVRLKNATHLLCICSTFAHGDPPANTRKFFNTVIPKTTGILFSVLALGSSLFADYCKAGVRLDKMLEEAGLTRLTKAITKADEANSGDAIVVQWLELMKRLLLPTHVEQELERRISQNSKPVVETKFVWLDSLPGDDVSPDDSTKSLCIANSELTDSRRGRSVRKITFESNGAAYETGDHLMVQTMNSSARIARFLTCFKEQLEKHFTTIHNGATSDDVIDCMLDKPFDLVATVNGATITNEYIFKTPTTLLKILAEDLDLTLTGSSATELVSVCIDACAKFKASAKVADFQKKMQPYLDGKQPLDDLIAYYPTIPHFFEAFPFLTSNALVSLADVLTVLPRMQPRYYSITSSPMVSADKISITVGVLDAESSKGAKFDGVCSHFLASLRENIDAVSIKVRPSNFRLPEVKSCPMIFVSAETGVGPFIGFLQELQIARNAGESIGQLHFFYGCRNENDFLYDHVLRRYKADGLITEIHVAMSKSTKRPSRYVEDMIKEMGPALGKLLQGNDTQYFVCGDAVMAQACYEAAIECMRHAAGGDMSRVAAVQKLQAMQLEQRWHADVWGITQNFEEAKKAVEESKKASAKVWLTKFGS